MKILLIILVTALLAGCGPSTAQRRACEMYLDAGGTKQLDYDVLVRFESSPEQIAKHLDLWNAGKAKAAAGWRAEGKSEEDIAEIQKIADENWANIPENKPEARARKAFDGNAIARGVVALRLGLTKSELTDALRKCEKSGMWRL